jgi:diguanylate cyclase (GGDEF)-like protein
MSNRATTGQGTGPYAWFTSPLPSASSRAQAIATQDAAALGAILPYAMAQAKRHHEPISVLCVAIDRIATIRALHGPGIADEMVVLVAGTIRGMLRSSDVVARLDESRLIVLLPDAGLGDALRLAETARTAITEVGQAAPGLPILTVSTGVANYPAHAHDAQSLLTVAVQAATAAERQGRDQVVAGTPAPVGSRLSNSPSAN